MNEADDLPDGWTVATIEDLCTLNPKHPSTVGDATEVSFVPMAAVSDIDGRIVGTETRKYGEVKKGFTHFADGDVIFAKITPCMENGKAASVRGLVNGLACGTTEFFVFRSRGAIDQDFLFHFIRQESFRRAARATMQSGVGQARVPKEFVLNTELPLPPLVEQRRIVEKIEELTARSRAARAALAEVPTLLEQFRQSVLASAFRGDLTADWREKHPDTEPASVLLSRIRDERRKQWEAKYPKKKYVEPDPFDDSDLPELPESWCWTTIEELSSLITSGSRDWSRYYDRGSGTFIMAQNVRPGRLDFSQVRQLVDPPVDNRDRDRSQVQPGDLLITIVGANTGDICPVLEPLPEHFVCQSVALIRPVVNDIQGFVLRYFLEAVSQPVLT
jgi:type I restriction enzyme S subunit